MRRLIVRLLDWLLDRVPLPEIIEWNLSEWVYQQKKAGRKTKA